MVKIMKNKVYLCTTIILIISLVCACSKKSDNRVKNIYSDDEIIDKYNISNDYDLKNAEKDGFVIYQVDGKIINNIKIKEFYENTTSNKEDILTIIRYTIEGDPLITQYNYKEGKFIVYEDNTRDKNDEGKIIMREIKNIELETEDGQYSIVEKY